MDLARDIKETVCKIDEYRGTSANNTGTISEQVDRIDYELPDGKILNFENVRTK